MFNWLKSRSGKDAASEARAYVRVGFEAYEKGDWSSARAAFEEARRRDASNADPSYFLGRIELSVGRCDAALEHFEAALRCDRTQPAFHFALGEALWRLGRLSAAAQALEVGLQSAPGDADWWHLLGRINAETAGPGAALEVFTRAQSAVPGDPRIEWKVGEFTFRTVGADAARSALCSSWSLPSATVGGGFSFAAFLLGEPDPDTTLALCRIVLEADRLHPYAAAVAGVLLARRGEGATAAALLEGATEINPDSALVWTHLGLARRMAGNHESAFAAFERAYAIAPDLLPVILEYGITAFDTGRVDAAEHLLNRAVTLEPANAHVHLMLGRLAIIARDYDDAEVLLRRANVLAGGYPDALVLLGKITLERGRYGEAIKWLLDAQAVMADSAVVQCYLGCAFGGLNKLDDAEQYLRRALTLDADLVEAHVNLSGVLIKQLLPTAAEGAAREALRLSPNEPDALLNLANALQAQGRYQESADALRRVVGLVPQSRHGWSNYLLALNYLGTITPEALLAEHRKFGAQPHWAPRRTRSAFARDRRPDRRLRIGYVSADFRTHVVGQFFGPVLANHAGAEVETYLYFTDKSGDTRTEWFRKQAGIWRDIADMTDDAAEAVMLEDELDIVVDLSGHTSNNRLQLLGRRVAPVQVTWLGYPNGTGLPAMDWRISDAIADPSPEADGHYMERLHRMPEVFIVYDPPTDAPDVTSAPSSVTGRVTFGVYNNYQKVTDEALALWRRVLDRVPGSTLVLKTPTMRDEGLQAILLARLQRIGLGPERVELRGPTKGFREHLATLASVDIVLDTFPYNGTTSTCETLWMGVPVVTLAGDRHAARVSASLLAAIGLGELVATDVEHYAELAVALAGDPERLSGLRSEIRGRMRRSLLTDVPRFTRHLEAAYRTMWKEWLTLPGGSVERDKA